MKLTENQFETIFNKIKDQKGITFSNIEGFDDFNEEDQTRIIREWTIYNSADYMIELAENIIKSNDGEPYTDFRIANKLNITISLAKIILDYVIKIEDGEIAIPTNKERCIKSLRNRIQPFIDNDKLEFERRKLLKEELDGICEKGDPERMILAMIIARMFRTEKHYFYAKGPITSSLVAYYLKIHDVDCFKYKIDYHFCHGINFEKNYQIEFFVSQEYQFKALSNTEELIYKGNLPVKTCWLDTKTGVEHVHPARFLVLKNEKLIEKCKMVEDYSGRKCPCLNNNQIKEYGKDIIPLYIFAIWDATFLERMNKIYPISNIDPTDVSDLNVLLSNGAMFAIKKYDKNFIKETYEHYKNLSYQKLVDCLCHSWANKTLIEKYLDDSSINSKDKALRLLLSKCSFGKAFSIVTAPRVDDGFSNSGLSLDNDTASNLSSATYLCNESLGNIEAHIVIQKCFYLLNFPEESMNELINTRFCNNKIKNNIITNSTARESEILKELLIEYHSKFVDRFIGIFFYINGKFSCYKERLIIDNFKEFIDVEKGHFDLFNSYKMPKELEYSMFPRGRILYNVKDNLYYIYGDKTILKDNQKLNILFEQFNLPKYNIKIKTDEHYKTLKY